MAFKQMKKSINITRVTGIESCSRSRVRELIRIRDNHTCQICGKEWVVGKRRFDVHHLDCDKEKSRQCDNYEKEKNNMLTLCHKCHLSLPEHRNVMKKKKRTLTDKERETVISLYKGGIIYRKISDKFGITPQAISKIVHKYVKKDTK